MTESVLCNIGANLHPVTLLFMVKAEGTCPRVVFLYPLLYLSLLGAKYRHARLR